MALDPSIILQAGNYKQPDLATTLGQLGQIRAQRDASELQKVQLSRLARQDKQEQADRAATVSALGKYASGDASGAMAAGGASGNIELVKQLQAMGDADRKRVFDISQHAAPILAEIAKAPPEQRAAAIAQAAPALQGAGWQPQQLAELQQNAGNDGWFSSKIAASHTIAEYEAKVAADRTADLASNKFAYEQKNDAANRGVTMRGQDFTHADSAAGRAVTMRGQNMTDHRDQEKIDLQKNAILPQQTAADIAAQYLAGDKSALGNLGRGTQGGANIAMVRNEISRQMKAAGMTGADVAGKMAEFSGMTASARTVGNISGKVDYGVNELSASIPLAAKASASLPRGSFVPLTQVEQMIGRGNSDPRLKDFAVKTNAVINAYNLVAGRAGTSVAQREHNAELLRTADSPQAYQAALSAMGMEGEVAKGASRQTMSDVTGRKGATTHAGGTLTPQGNVLVWKPH